MTLPRFMALSKHWQEHPPLEVLVAGFVGFKSEARRQSDYGDLNELLAMFPTGVIA
jgi:hypothetical protein